MAAVSGPPGFTPWLSARAPRGHHVELDEQLIIYVIDPDGPLFRYGAVRAGEDADRGPVAAG